MRLTRIDTETNTTRTTTGKWEFEARHISSSDTFSPKYNPIHNALVRVVDKSLGIFSLRGERLFSLNDSEEGEQRRKENALLFPRELAPILFSEETVGEILRGEAALKRERDRKDRDAGRELLNAEHCLKRFDRVGHKPATVEYWLKISDWHAHNGAPFDRDENGEIALSAQINTFLCAYRAGDQTKRPAACFTTTTTDLVKTLRDARLRAFFLEHELESSVSVEEVPEKRQ